MGAPGGLGQRPSPGLQRTLNSGESAKRRVTMSDSASPCVRRPRLPVRCKRSADAQMKGAVRADHSARSNSCEARRDSPLPPCRKLPHPPGHRRAFAAPLSTKPRPWRTSSAHVASAASSTGRSTSGSSAPRTACPLEPVREPDPAKRHRRAARALSPQARLRRARRRAHHERAGRRVRRGLD